MKAKFNDSVTISPLQPDDREQFILDNQRAFKYGATEEFGLRDDHFLCQPLRFPHRGVFQQSPSGCE